MISRYSFALAAILCLPALSLSQEAQISVKSRYPQAYTWYCDMAKKYPTANLNQIEFCISDHHHAGSGVIFWAESNLRIINDSYQASSEISDKTRQLMQEDEYLLLHEAEHVNKNHTLKGNIALTAATTASAGLTTNLILQTCAQALPAITATAQGLAINAALTATVYLYARSQESQADSFANQTADKQALEAGTKWHQNNHNELQISPNQSSISQTVQEICSDPAHPAPSARLQESSKALQNRFGSTQPSALQA